MNTYNNPILEKLPLHLRQYVVEQHYERYTPIDQAVWRYVMRQNYSYLKDVAYYPYIPGLRAAGLTIEHIPDLQSMNDNLKKIGWGAVTVDGFIPPVAFMEFQAHHVLVIAADIRQLEHIEYTPAPDIIHESSGHAPIIAEADYATYLSYFGEIGSKAMFSYQDFEQYEAIRKLSILKESHDATEAEIAEAEADLQRVQQNMGEPSEMALLSRLHWWTVEYGLIGTLDDPKIYGAGLLSSIGESATCMQPDVPKLPYSIDTVNYSYDITKPQPQLFVTPTFEQLIAVLEEFANGMAFRMGGKASIDKAIACQNTCTAIYSSGLQVSGVFADSGYPELIYLKTTGPTALAFDDKELEGHGKSYHKDGFSAPVGKLKGYDKALEDVDAQDLTQAGIIVGKHAELTFNSGITVSGTVVKLLRRADKLILITFEDCTVLDPESDRVLFEPTWGTYDMAVGEKIISVYCGAADKDAFEQIALVSSSYTHKQQYDDANARLHQHYKRVRTIRQEHSDTSELSAIWNTLKEEHPQDWLCAMEVLEILEHEAPNSPLAEEIRAWLTTQADQNPKIKKLIHDGLGLIDNPMIGVLNK